MEYDAVRGSRHMSKLTMVVKIRDCWKMWSERVIGLGVSKWSDQGSSSMSDSL